MTWGLFMTIFLVPAIYATVTHSCRDFSLIPDKLYQQITNTNEAKIPKT